MGRQRWERRDTDRDVELLVWIARFRFVTAEVVAERFGITVQRSRARLRRLERAGLLGSWRGHVSQAKAFWITGRGGAAIGLRRRRPPQPTQAREHEDAIVALACRLELRPGSHQVLTERECRSRERGLPQDLRYSVQIDGSGRRPDRSRWPDLVVEADARRVAFEIEFAPKTTGRLSAILDGYNYSSYARVVFFVASPRLAGRLAQLWSEKTTVPSGLRRVSTVELCIRPWHHLDEARSRAVTRAAQPHS